MNTDRHRHKSRDGAQLVHAHPDSEHIPGRRAHLVFHEANVQWFGPASPAPGLAEARHDLDASIAQLRAALAEAAAQTLGRLFPTKGNPQ